MTQRQQQALQLFNSGFNCAQSVLAVFAEHYGLDPATATRISCGLGGGVRCGELCGAVSGAVLVIGLAGGNEPADKKRCMEQTERFTAQFKEKHDALGCYQLLDCNLKTAEGFQHYTDQQLRKKVCEALICDAIELLEDLGCGQ